MARVQLLPEDLINQIAAGEVVERPASVVKELAENAIDAGATQVTVQLSEGGLSAITVIDDGFGMSAQDAQLALQRHATSKLRDAEGLFHILTKGFRGEALPSIASVSRFTLTTAEPGALVATRLSLEGGGAPLVEEAAAVGGTRIDVNDLFFNVPARRKFLKRESTELGHCEDAIIRLALPHPEVGFVLEHGGKRLFTSPATAAAPKERVAAVLGAEAAPHLLEIGERRLGITVSGFIASPEFTLNTARGLFTFVNHRYIRDRGLNGAIQRAYQDQLPPGRQPVAVIFIEVDPRAVDVNVHPQKLEVRFADPRSVQEAVGAAVARALKAAPWRQDPSAPVEQVPGAHYASAVERFLARAQQPGAFVAPQGVPEAGEVGASGGFGTALPGLNDAPPPGFFEGLRFLGELGRRFWVCEAPGGTLVVVDPRAVVERVQLERLTRAFKKGELEAAPRTLFSATVELPEPARARLVACAPALHRLGLEVEPFGGDTVVVSRVPEAVEGADLVALLSELAPALPTPADALPDFGPALKLLATHGSTPPRSVTHEQVRALFTELDDADFSRPCVHGRVVLHELTLFELQSRAD
jgi:DNA mismatch repair protein MutL